MDSISIICQFYTVPYLQLHILFCLGVSEVTMGEHPIRTCNVKIANNKQKLMFILRTSKTHGRYNRPQKVKITAVPNINKHRMTRHEHDHVKIFCPYQCMKEYISLRPKQASVQEPLFIFRDRNPVKLTHMHTVLRKMLQNSGYNGKLYNMHSLCTGRLVDLLKLGVSIPKICILGWWRLNAVFTYLNQ